MQHSAHIRISCSELFCHQPTDNFHFEFNSHARCGVGNVYHRKSWKSSLLSRIWLRDSVNIPVVGCLQDDMGKCWHEQLGFGRHDDSIECKFRSHFNASRYLWNIHSARHGFDSQYLLDRSISKREAAWICCLHMHIWALLANFIRDSAQSERGAFAIIRHCIIALIRTHIVHHIDISTTKSARNEAAQPACCSTLVRSRRVGIIHRLWKFNPVENKKRTAEMRIWQQQQTATMLPKHVHKVWMKFIDP